MKSTLGFSYKHQYNEELVYNVQGWKYNCSGMYYYINNLIKVLKRKAQRRICSVWLKVQIMATLLECRE